MPLWILTPFILMTQVGLSQSATDSGHGDTGWNHWRGPEENGTSRETSLPDDWSAEGRNLLWTYDISGGGTPVVANERVFVFGYRGEGPDLQEVLLCLNAQTGERIWERRFSDFLSDIVYNRYAIGSPAIDTETGNVYLLTSAGLLLGYSRDGEALWERSMMEEFGRLSFPNGRTGSPSIAGDLVIVHGITAAWGRLGPARDRYYAFEKKTGDLVWASQPGVQPKDSSFTPLTFGWLDGRRVFYSGTGCGNVVCVDVFTGQPLWRFQLSRGGINSAVLLVGEDRVVAIHGKENLDTSAIGGMVSLKIPRKIPEGAKLPLVLGEEAVLWRNELESFTSSPVLHGDRIYQIVRTGELKSVDLITGNVEWSMKLSQDQLHASPLWADEKLYVPMLDGGFYIIRPGERDAEVISKVQLEGNCIGAPAAYGGRVFVLTKKKLYCIGSVERPVARESARPVLIRSKRPSALQIVPAEFAGSPGSSIELFTVEWSDFGGIRKLEQPFAWSGLNSKTGVIDSSGRLTIQRDAPVSTINLTAESKDRRGRVRGRILPSLPFSEDFNSSHLTENSPKGYAFSYPPAPWLGARLRWQIIEHGGDRVLANTLERVLFQRTTTFIGHPDMKDYIMQADVMSDGNRRVLSNIGIINQRYNASLIGNWQILEIVSNHDRLKVSVPFEFRASVWYRLKMKVETEADGSGVIRAKAWERSLPEPDDWTIEAPHKNAHRNGSPGLYAFSPQSQKRVYVDNIVVTPNGRKE